MAAKSTALTLTSAAPTKRQSFKIQPQNIVMQQVSKLWQTLDATTQGAWQTLADSQIAPTVQGIRSTVTAYGQFFAHNSNLLNAQMPTVTEAPNTRPNSPIPPVQLVITYQGNTPVLSLVPNSAYPHGLILMGAKPLYPGQNIYTKGSFKQIGALPNLSTSTDISHLYLSKYRLPTPGYQIALNLIGVSPDGFRTAPLFVTAIALKTSTADTPTLTVG